MVWPIREVNLLPCFLCVVGGVAIWWRELSPQATRFHLLDFDGAARLAALRVGLMALLIFRTMFVALDRSDNQLSPGDRGGILGEEMRLRRVHREIHCVMQRTVWPDLQITGRTYRRVVWPSGTADRG
jgi:hypothetical protein